MIAAAATLATVAAASSTWKTVHSLNLNVSGNGFKKVKLVVAGQPAIATQGVAMLLQQLLLQQ